MELKKLVTRKLQWATDKKLPKKSLLPIARGPEKRQLSKTENF